MRREWHWHGTLCMSREQKRSAKTYLWLACTRFDFFSFLDIVVFGRFSVFLYTPEAVIPPAYASHTRKRHTASDAGPYCSGNTN